MSDTGGRSRNTPMKTGLASAVLSNLSSAIARRSGRSRGYISVGHVDGGWCGSPRFRLLDPSPRVIGEGGGIVLRIEFDPGGGSSIVPIFYSDSDPLRSTPPSIPIHNGELKPGQGGG